MTAHTFNYKMTLFILFELKLPDFVSWLADQLQEKLVDCWIFPLSIHGNKNYSRSLPKVVNAVITHNIFQSI